MLDMMFIFGPFIWIMIGTFVMFEAPIHTRHVKTHIALVIGGSLSIVYVVYLLRKKLLEDRVNSER